MGNLAQGIERQLGQIAEANRGAKMGANGVPIGGTKSGANLETSWAPTWEPGP